MKHDRHLEGISIKLYVKFSQNQPKGGATFTQKTQNTNSGHLFVCSVTDAPESIVRISSTFHWTYFAFPASCANLSSSQQWLCDLGEWTRDLKHNYYRAANIQWCSRRKHNALSVWCVELLETQSTDCSNTVVDSHCNDSSLQTGSFVTIRLLFCLIIYMLTSDYSLNSTK